MADMTNMSVVELNSFLGHEAFATSEVALENAAASRAKEVQATLLLSLSRARAHLLLLFLSRCLSLYSKVPASSSL